MHNNFTSQEAYKRLGSMAAEAEAEGDRFVCLERLQSQAWGDDSGKDLDDSSSGGSTLTLTDGPSSASGNNPPRSAGGSNPPRSAGGSKPPSSASIPATLQARPADSAQSVAGPFSWSHRMTLR
jgi:hypothetical protein